MQESYFQVKDKNVFIEVDAEKSKRLTGSLQKENKFMGEQIRRLTEEKIKVERKALENEKIVRRLE